MNSPPGTCSVCLDIQPSEIMTTVNHDPVCYDCIRQTFQRALDYEGNYPPKWDKHVLDIQEYAQQGILTRDFPDLYHQKEKEYRCPPVNRIYCSWSCHKSPQQTDDKNTSKGKGKGRSKGKGKAIDKRCNNFLGARILSTVDVFINNDELVVRCEDCENLSCRACENRIKSFAQAVAHKCLPARASDTNDAAFEGLRRGKDFQICPYENCQRKIELIDGCNHIRCTCGAQFCFVCGQSAMDGSYHWTRTNDPKPGCPRYKQPGSPNAIYDYSPPRGLRARNPLFDDEFAAGRLPLDDDIPPLHAPQTINPVSLTVQEINALEESISLQEHYDAQGSPRHAEDAEHARILDIVAQATRDQTHFGQGLRRQTIATLGPAAPAPALITGPSVHGHPYHIEPMPDIGMVVEEVDVTSTQRARLQQHQLRMQYIREQIPTASEFLLREFLQGGGSSPPSSRGPNEERNPTSDNVSRARPRAHIQHAVQQSSGTDTNRQPAVHAHTAPRFPSAADVQARRSWYSMLPLRTNSSIASISPSQFGLVPGPRSRSAPLQPLPPLFGAPLPEDTYDRGRGQGTTAEPPVVVDAGFGSGREDASEHDSGFEED